MKTGAARGRSLRLASAGCCGNGSFATRSARAGDLQAVQALLREADLPLAGVESQFGDSFAVVEEGGVLLGVAGIERCGDYGLLRSAVVAPSARGRGLGEALVLDRIDWSTRAGLRALYLLTTSAADYFPRFGFRTVLRDDVPAEVRASAEFTSACPSSAIALVLPLAAGHALRGLVRLKYGAAARRARSGEAAHCGCGCGTGNESRDPITSNLYEEAETAGLPAQALLASLGCGNPAALAGLKPGEVVLDLGSGGGIDVLLSAKRVGPTGKAYGLDMTDEMLTLARSNQQAAGAENVEFLKGEIEDIPLPDASVDVIISNCVINLAADKRRVLQEAFRVLRPGGRFAVSDVVVQGPVPPELRRSMELWIGCVAGALEENEYRSLLAAAGFTAIDIEPTRVYQAEDASAFLSAAGFGNPALRDQVAGRVFSAFVRATRPAAEPVQ